MKEESPLPLDAGADTPPELRAALRALAREAPARSTLDRAARGLEPYLDAAPGLSTTAAIAARTSGKLLAARALAALLALGGTAFLVHRGWPREQVSAPTVAKPPAASAALAAQAAPEAPTLVPPPPIPSTAEAPALEQPRHDAPAGRHARRRVIGRAAGHRLARGLEAESASVQPTATSSTSIEEGDSTPASVAPAPAAAVAVAAVQPAPLDDEAAPEAPTKPPPDEVTLLWQARERMRRDPAGALALLDAHAERFASGQLAPEREVLAVEALRLLGRNDEADRRVRKFRARYPGSIHLRRLENSR